MNIPSANISFKSNSQSNVMGYDDSISTIRRKYIRNRLEKQYMPAFYLYDDRMLEKYDLDKLIASLTARTEFVYPSTKERGVDDDKMKKLFLYNVGKLPALDSYRGAVGNLRNEHVKLLADAGIKRVIALAGCNVPACEFQKCGIEFISFPVDDYKFSRDAFTSESEVRKKTLSQFRDVWGYNDRMTSCEVEFELEKWRKNKEKFIGRFVKFIQAMQQGSVYMGCELGTITTDNAVKLNYFFNPKAKNSRASFDEITKGDFYKFRNLYKNLSQKDKEKMGWDKDFDEQFIPRLKDEYSKIEYKF